MSRDHFKIMLRFIWFGNENSRAETDEVTSIQDKWTVLNKNIMQPNKPHECITNDDQLFLFGDHTKFTQYIHPNQWWNQD